MDVGEGARRPQTALGESAPAAELASAPLTNATLAAFTVGLTATAAAWAGIAAVETATAGFLALVMGLMLAVPTVATGFLEHLHVPRGSARRRSATARWLTMAGAVSLFLVAAALLDDGYRSGQVPGAGVGVAAGAELMLVLGAAPPGLGGRRAAARRGRRGVGMLGEAWARFSRRVAPRWRWRGFMRRPSG